MEAIPSVIRHHTCDNIQENITYNNVTYNVSEFVFPSIFYSLKLSIENQQQIQIVKNVQCASGDIGEKLKKPDDFENNGKLWNGNFKKNDNNSTTLDNKIDLEETPSNMNFKELCGASTSKNALAIVRPKFLEFKKMRPPFSISSIKRKLLDSLKSTFLRSDIKKIYINVHNLKRNLKLFILKYNENHILVQPQLVSSQNKSIENLNVIPWKKNQCVLDLNEESFSSKNIGNNSGKLNVSNTKYKESSCNQFMNKAALTLHFSENEHDETLDMSVTINSNFCDGSNEIVKIITLEEENILSKLPIAGSEQSILHLLPKDFNESKCIETNSEKLNVSSTKYKAKGNSIDLTLQLSQHEHENLDNICDDSNNIVNILTVEENVVDKISNASFVAQSNLLSNNLKEAVSKRSKSSLQNKKNQPPKHLQTTSSTINKKQTKVVKQKEKPKKGMKRKADHNDFFERNHDDRDKKDYNNSKLTKYHYGDKGSNQKYSNAVGKYGNSYSDLTESASQSSGSSYNSYYSYDSSYNSYSGYDYNNQLRDGGVDFQDRSDFDQVNDFDNQDRIDFDYQFSRDGKTDKPAYLLVRDQWRLNGNRGPDPHFNWTFRHSIVTRNQIKSNKCIKLSIIPSYTQQLRCNLPTNILHNRIQSLEDDCHRLESRMDRYDRPRSQISNDQFGYRNFDDRRHDFDTVSQEMDNTLRQLAQFKEKLGKFRNMREDIALMYSDMLSDVNYGMLTESNENEIKEIWDRLRDYEQIYKS